jgi:hypothetical protein
MATAQQIREEIRVAIGDDDHANETYTDQQLNIFIRAALRRLANRVGMTITITLGAFSTAPSDQQADLISLQSQCLFAQRQFREAVDKGVRVRQDENEIDTSAGLGGYKESVSGKYSACAMLEEDISDYIENNPDLEIESVTSKYAADIWAGTQNLYDDVDFNGQGEDRLWHQGRGDRRSSHRNRNRDNRFTTDD